MLKWRYPAEQNGRVDQPGFPGDTREGADCRCCSTDHAELRKKYEHLQLNANFRGRFIRAFLEDKERSIRLIEDALQEFPRLDQELVAKQQQATWEKQKTEKLKTELEVWKREYANLKARGYILQAQVDRIKSTRSSNLSRHRTPTMKDMDTAAPDNKSSQKSVRKCRLDLYSISKFEGGYVSSANAQRSDISREMLSSNDKTGFISGGGSRGFSPPKQTQRPKASLLKKILWRLKFKRKKCHWD